MFHRKAVLKNIIAIESFFSPKEGLLWRCFMYFVFKLFSAAFSQNTYKRLLI